MPTLLHDPAVRDSIRARVEKLTPESTRKWGKMTVDQMLWHCGMSLGASLGHTTHSPFRPAPLPRWLLKFMVFNLPWPKGAPSHPDWLASQHYDFGAEKVRTLGCINEFTSRGLDETSWADSPALGPMTGTEWSRLQAIHLDHHLRQFGV